MVGGFSLESIFTILSPAFLSTNVTFLGGGGGVGGSLRIEDLGVGFLKKDLTESIIPSPYMCCFVYFLISGSYFLLNSDCRIILSIELYKIIAQTREGLY